MDNYKIYASEQFVEEKIKESQADWSQNDENAAGYVKNRTHWVETTETTFINNESYVTADLFGMGLPALVLSTTLELTDGATFAVVLNNVEYQATCRWATDASGGAVLGMGNLELLGLPTDGIDTECPFIMANQGGTAVLISPDVASIGDTITLSIIRVVEEVHQIDKKYLPTPDLNQNDPSSADYVKNRTHWVESINTLIYDNESLEITYLNETVGITPVPTYKPTAPPEGPCTVIINDVSYSATARSYDTRNSIIGNMSLFGNLDADGLFENDYIDINLPFVLSVTVNSTADDMDILICTVDILGTNNTITISLTAPVPTYHPLNEKYIPESISRIGRSGSEDYSEIFNNYVNNTASGRYSHAEGENTTAMGDYSHAEGSGTSADGVASHTEGYYTETKSDYSHAEGYFTSASGGSSHAEGFYAKASGGHSHAEGYYTLASSSDQHVQGKYNIEDATNKYAHIVGNGASVSARSNAHTLDWDGNAWFAGEVKVGGTGQDDAEAKTLATTEYIDNKFSTSNLNTLTVGNATSADKVAQSLKFGSKTYNGSSEQTITAGDLGLESAIRFVGMTSTAITDGGTQSPVVDGETHIPIRGDVVIRSSTDQEFIWNGSAWEELGNSSSHALKSITISAGAGLTGGGSLEANRTISLATSGATAGTYGAASSPSHGGTFAIPSITVDTYGRVTEASTVNVTLPADSNTDTKVKQTSTASTVTTKYPVLMSAQSSPTSGTAYEARYNTAVTIGSGVLFGAAWNDYAEYRESDTIEPGRVICENGDDTLSLATERLQPGANVVSDTFGFVIGETENAKTPIAVSGRVLVYPYEDRNSYNPGDAVCAAPNGTVSKMTREEIREYPERIIGTVSAIPEYETWGTGNVPVNGRIWIKIK